MKMFQVKILICLLFLVSPESQSAEIFLSAGNDGADGNTPTCKLTISGEIAEGDSRKLQAILSDNPIDILYTPLVELTSPGGSVAEALAISDIINKHRFSVNVPAHSVCASACALIYLTAPMRFREGVVALHRPYFDVNSIDITRMDDYAAQQQKAAHSIRDYLTSRGVSSSLVDKMMRLPSNLAYNLTRRDDYELGYMSPMFEEFTINVCGLNNRDLARSSYRDAQCVMQNSLVSFRALAYRDNYGRDTYQHGASLVEGLADRGERFDLNCGR